MGEINGYPRLTTIQVAKPRFINSFVNILLVTCRYSVETRHVANIFVESSDKRKPLL